MSSATEKDSSQKAKLEAADREFTSQANRVAAEVAKDPKAHSYQVASYVLGKISADNNDFPRAIPLLTLTANAAPVKVCEEDVSRGAYQLLLQYSSDPAVAESWFKRYASKYEPSAYEWVSEGERRAKAKDYAHAATAYEKAASDNFWAYAYCKAAESRYFQEPPEPDALLADGRKCVDSSVKSDNKDRSFYDEWLPEIYNDMAEVLEKRGVYPQAMEYIKSSLALKPVNPWALYTEAKLFEDTQRTTECISAAQAAIRTSDGKYSVMQFQLGQCYFHAENWSQAERSFRIAAEADKTDYAAAFNLGLSLKREGFGADARQWFQEALRRNPSPEVRNKIQELLR